MDVVPINNEDFQYSSSSKDELCTNENDEKVDSINSLLKSDSDEDEKKLRYVSFIVWQSHLHSVNVYPLKQILCSSIHTPPPEDFSTNSTEEFIVCNDNDENEKMTCEEYLRQSGILSNIYTSSGFEKRMTLRGDNIHVSRQNMMSLIDEKCFQESRQLMVIKMNAWRLSSRQNFFFERTK